MIATEMSATSNANWIISAHDSGVTTYPNTWEHSYYGSCACRMATLVTFNDDGFVFTSPSTSVYLSTSYNYIAFE